uniref:Uncharacterized protein n=1 Tax=Arundo donax TaxID=35708 RepID=A0A0A8XWK2_ARUDO
MKFCVCVYFSFSSLSFSLSLHFLYFILCLPFWKRSTELFLFRTTSALLR